MQALLLQHQIHHLEDLTPEADLKDTERYSSISIKYNEEAEGLAKRMKMVIEKKLFRNFLKRMQAGRQSWKIEGLCMSFGGLTYFVFNVG